MLRIPLGVIAHRCSIENFLKIACNSLENICDEVLF